MAIILVTGSNGFVGKHLIDLLKSTTSNEIVGLDKDEADITDFESVKQYLDKVKPDQVYHLAGFASGAGKDKDLIFKVNVQGTENILRALSETGKPVKILLASTAYVYGNIDICAEESAETDARSFYDQSKLEMEKMAFEYSSREQSESRSSQQVRTISVFITRAANHTGPGQKLGFVVPDFCSQIAKASDGDTISVGNLDAKRDLFDVRDCIRAYKIVMEKGKSGDIYNIGTGRTISIKDILERLIKISGKNVNYKIDPKRMRLSDIAQNCVNPTNFQNSRC